MAGVTVWKGKQIRAQLSMIGDGWEKLHPEVKKRAIRVLEKANRKFASLGLQVGIFEGWRDVSEQTKRIESGSSGVKNPLHSYHPWGLAVDFVFLKGPGMWTWEPTGDPVKDRQLWNELGEIIKGEGFEWGGDWKSLFDGPHAQYTALDRSVDLLAKYHDPEAFITWA